MPNYRKFDSNIPQDIIRKQAKINTKPNTYLLDLKNLIKAKMKLNEDFILCGIYFLIKNHNIVYVGSSSHLFTRIKSHITENKKDFDSFSYVVCEEQDRLLLESKYILKYLPKYNESIPCSHENINYILIPFANNTKKKNIDININISIKSLKDNLYISIEDIKNQVINKLTN